jgi:hypothetical protein
MRHIFILLSAITLLCSCNGTLDNKSVHYTEDSNLELLRQSMDIHTQMLQDNIKLTVTYSLDSTGKLVAFYNPNGFDLQTDTNLIDISENCKETDVEHCLLQQVLEGKVVSAKSCAVCFYYE